MAQGKCLSFSKTVRFPALYVISRATKGPATWCLQMPGRPISYQEFLHCLYSARASSIQREEDPGAPHCHLPLPGPSQQFSTRFPQGSPTACIIVCKMDVWLLVTCLPCEVGSLRQDSWWDRHKQLSSQLAQPVRLLVAVFHGAPQSPTPALHVWHS